MMFYLKYKNFFCFVLFPKQTWVLFVVCPKISTVLQREFNQFGNFSLDKLRFLNCNNGWLIEKNVRAFTFIEFLGNI